MIRQKIGDSVLHHAGSMTDKFVISFSGGFQVSSPKVAPVQGKHHLIVNTTT
jgi:hypothetical protein